MGDLLRSIVRTIVPVIVGLVLAGAARAGIDLDPETAGQLTLALDAIVIGVYYAVVRWAEQRWAAVGWLLGLPVPPTYDTTSAPRRQ